MVSSTLPLSLTINEVLEQKGEKLRQFSNQEKESNTKEQLRKSVSTGGLINKESEGDFHPRHVENFQERLTAKRIPNRESQRCW